MRHPTVLLVLIACDADKGHDRATGTTGDTATPTTPAAGIRVIGDRTNLPAERLLSIWGADSADVWVVGGDPDDGLGPLVLHYDGSAWTRLATGTTGDLWWVWSDGGDTVLFSGDGGRVVAHSRSAGTFTEEVVTQPVYKLFGTWGTSTSDVWTVGGDTNGGIGGVAAHGDGATWTDAFVAPPDPTDGVTLRQVFKVWGAASDDVWLVGTSLLLVHWDGAGFDLSHDQPLGLHPDIGFVTVHGRAADDVYVVGGFGNGVVARWDGTAWLDETPPLTALPPGFNGVFASQTGGTVTCGKAGSIWWRDDTGVWAPDPRPTNTTLDFHACWIDETGEPWAVGGDLTGGSAPLLVTGNPTIPPVL